MKLKIRGQNPKEKEVEVELWLEYGSDCVHVFSCKNGGPTYYVITLYPDGLAKFHIDGDFELK
jgi:hypothetical protein